MKMFCRRLLFLVASASVLASTTSQSNPLDPTASGSEALPESAQVASEVDDYDTIDLKAASLNSDNPLLRSSSSKTVMVSQGEKLALFCESQEPFDYCEWKNLKTQAKCNLASNDVDNAMDCNMGNQRFQWDVSQTRCGILVDSATREDVGSYQCYMFAGSASNFVRHVTEVDVATRAVVTFTGQLSTDSEVRTRAGDPLVVECQAMGGYPAPKLRASLGPEPNHIHSDPKIDHNLGEIAAEEITNPDGTVDLKKKFTLVVQAHDCGKYIKCESSQMDQNGNELFVKQGRTVSNRKLMVLFPPENMNRPLPPIAFGMDEPTKIIRMQFMANPAPSNNQAIWHINPSRQVGTDSIVLQAGTSHRDKYVAAPLNVTGHAVEAVLVIKNPVELDAGFEYFLEASNEIGTQKYPFELQYRPQSGLIGTDVDRETDNQSSESTEETTSGLGIGIVIGIIVLVLVILGSIAGIFWMRANKKLCFAEATPKGTAGKPSAESADQAEKGDSAEPSERENLKGNGV